MVKGEVVLDRDDLDPLIRTREFMLPLSANMIFAPSKKNIAYGSPFRGLVADLYFWNRTLTSREMTSYTTDCTYLPSMDRVILDWSKVGLQGGPTEDLAYKEVDKCQSRLGTGEASVGLIPTQVTWYEAEAACMAMGGRMANYDEEDFVQLRQTVDPKGEACGFIFWTPMQKVVGTKQIMNTVTGKIVPYDSIPMQPGQPNGGDLQPCMTLNVQNEVERVWDDGCGIRMCFACRFDTLPKVTIHGEVCAGGEDIDRNFFLLTSSKQVFFRGFSGTKVELVGEKKDKSWVVKNANGAIVGSVVGKPVAPMGRYEWEFAGCPRASNVSSLKMTQVMQPSNLL